MVPEHATGWCKADTKRGSKVDLCVIPCIFKYLQAAPLRERPLGWDAVTERNQAWRNGPKSTVRTDSLCHYANRQK